MQGVDLRKTELRGARLSDAQISEVLLLPSQETNLGPIEDASLEIKAFSPTLEFGRIGSVGPQAKSLGTAPRGKPTYLVLFATNRNRVQRSGRITFSNGRSPDLSFGSCQVVIPESHEVGSIGSGFFKRWVKGSDDRLTIKKLVSLNGELYWKLVQQNFLGSTGSSPPTVLIHGYRTPFEEAVLWAAQLGFDLGLKRGVNLFSWPSQGTLTGYLADESSAEWSKYHLAEYLMDFAKHCDGIGVNVIAHSMGCRCLALALEVIGLKQPSLLKAFNHFVLAAADVDQDAMKKLGAYVVGNAGLTTSYICGKDVALSASGWAHSYARVGLLPPVFIHNDIDTVEVGKADLLGLGHGYVSGAASVLRDIFEILRHATPPKDRFSIQAVSSGSTAHWKLRE